MIHVIEGDGKGKTSSAVGLAIRASGHRMPVLFIQFLKDGSSGEIEVMKKIEEITILFSPNNYGFVYQMTNDQLEKTAIEYEKMMNDAIEADVQIIILDEVFHAMNAGLIKEKQILELLNKDVEIVLTGRNAPQWILERADYISYIEKRKHPYDCGVEARIGIEY